MASGRQLPDPVGSKIKGRDSDFGVFVRKFEGLIHVSQLGAERVDKPSSLYKPGDEVEAEVRRRFRRSQNRLERESAAPLGGAPGNGELS